MSASPARLFHVVERAAWDAYLASGSGTWTPPSFEREGFVHLSFAGQVAGTLERHFAGATRVVLVEVDGARVADELRLEGAHGGTRFPHLYRTLAEVDLVRGWELARAWLGWTPPRLGSTPAADEPQGRPALVRRASEPE